MSTSSSSGPTDISRDQSAEDAVAELRGLCDGLDKEWIEHTIKESIPAERIANPLIQRFSDDVHIQLHGMFKCSRGCAGCKKWLYHPRTTRPL